MAQVGDRRGDGQRLGSGVGGGVDADADQEDLHGVLPCSVRYAVYRI